MKLYGRSETMEGRGTVLSLSSMRTASGNASTMTLENIVLSDLWYIYLQTSFRVRMQEGQLLHESMCVAIPGRNLERCYTTCHSSFCTTLNSFVTYISFFPCP